MRLRLSAYLSLFSRAVVVIDGKCGLRELSALGLHSVDWKERDLGKQRRRNGNASSTTFATHLRKDIRYFLINFVFLLLKDTATRVAKLDLAEDVPRVPALRLVKPVSNCVLGIAD